MAKQTHKNRSRAVSAGMAVLLLLISLVGGVGGVGAQAPTSCSVTYSITNQWQGGFQGDVTIRNTGSAAMSGWTLIWDFPNGQAINQIWNGSYTQSSARVSVTNAAWNGSIAAGASAGFGFTASWNGTNGQPASFTVNGVTCGGAAMTAVPTATRTRIPTPTAGGPTATRTPTPTAGVPTATRTRTPRRQLARRGAGTHRATS